MTNGPRQLNVNQLALIAASDVALLLPEMTGAFEGVRDVGPQIRTKLPVPKCLNLKITNTLQEVPKNQVQPNKGS